MSALPATQLLITIIIYDGFSLYTCNDDFTPVQYISWLLATMHPRRRVNRIMEHIVQSNPLAATNSVTSKPNVTLDDHLDRLSPTLPPPLRTLIVHILSAVREVADILRSSLPTRTSSNNTFGDDQLSVDLSTDKAIATALRRSRVVSGFASEESPEITVCDDLAVKNPARESYVVSYDPLDGSSIINANFAVGTIMSVWNGNNGFIGKRVGDQVMALYATYGPRVTVVLAIGRHPVVEVTLINQTFVITQTNIQIAVQTKTFAPANLRAHTSNNAYRTVINHYLSQNYTLRYSGGLVPDIHHILTANTGKKSADTNSTTASGSGIYLSPVSPSAKAKLRLLFELASIAFIVVRAHGDAVTDDGRSMMDVVVKSADDRLGIVCGSHDEVQRYLHALQDNKK